MNNSIFEKTIEDVQQHTQIELVSPDEEEWRLHKMIADPAFIGQKIFHRANLVAVYRL